MQLAALDCAVRVEACIGGALLKYEYYIIYDNYDSIVVAFISLLAFEEKATLFLSVAR